MTLDDLDQICAPLRAYIAAAIEFPEPAQKLDMASREGAPDRQFKHLHQMCLFHSSNFTRANQIKIVALLDGYKAVIAADNPIGPYLFARSVLELSAFICDVSARLREIAAKPDANWRAKGEEFFSMIVRARFATTDPKKRQALEAAGMPSRLLKPINVMESVAKLLAQPGAADVLRDQYDKLCDFVHHNLSSQVTSSPGFRMGDVAHSTGGGALVMMKGGPITRYEYPVPHKPKLAVEETLPIVMKCVEVCVEHLNRIPETPFSAELLRERTGSSIGLTTLIPGSINRTQH
jgi:hypothetical protein